MTIFCPFSFRIIMIILAALIHIYLVRDAAVRANQINISSAITTLDSRFYILMLKNLFLINNLALGKLTSIYIDTFVLSK